MATRLTDKIVTRLPCPDRGSRITFDSVVPGHGVRVTANGSRSFIFDYRVGGRQRRLTIGKFPAYSTTAAREEAKTLYRRSAVGEDPMAERHAERRAPTVADLCDRYIEEHLPTKRRSSQAEDRSTIDTIVLPRLGKVKVANVTHADIDALHREISRRAPYRANRAVALTSKMFSLAIRWGYRPDNPARGVQRNPETKRNRYLTAEELGRLIAELNVHPDQQAADAVRMLLFTGARKNEVLSATWTQFDLAQGVWTKPGATTKQKTDHRVPLSAPTRKLLVDLQERTEGPHLFPGRVLGKPRVELKKFWAQVCEAADIHGCRIHDLRHTYASILASSGLSLPVIGALLGHTQPGTTARYAHLFDDPLRAATERVASFVAASGEAREGEVIDLKTAKSKKEARV